AMALLRSQLDGIEVPAAVLAEAVQVTGGNPRFLGEVAGRLAESGADAGRALETQLAITVEQAVDARVAALTTDERDVLEKAAVLGNVFWVGALVVLSRIGHDAREGATTAFAHDRAGEHIGRILDELVERDYVLAIPDPSIPGEREYCFKHN